MCPKCGAVMQEVVDEGLEWLECTNPRCGHTEADIERLPEGPEFIDDVHPLAGMHDEEGHA